MLKNLTILYAEDEDFVRESVLEVLELMQINVVAVKNGKEALKEYKKNKPDIIISDIEMPEMNGLEFIEKIREINKTIPIIITTAYTNTEYFLKAVELHLVKYILKPITLIDLRTALQDCVNILEVKEHTIRLSEDCYYDMKQHILIYKESEKKLDFNERKFLELLLNHANLVVPYEQIESNVWEYGMTDAALRSLVRNLRQKLPEDVIQNISKVGYKIVVQY